MLTSINQSTKAGTNENLNMMLGIPNDTQLDIWKTFLFLIKSSWYGAHDAVLAVFSPYPGTVIYEELKKK